MDVLSVGQVLANYEQLNGKLIRVEGIVFHCRKLGCDLRDVNEPQQKGFGLGSAPGFDAQVNKLLNRRIVVEGKLDATCLQPYERPLSSGEVEITLCTDRASALLQPKIIRVRS